ncbi:AAA family ATPase [Lysinibacillus capsici]|uniref:AAA family ATPase n=1 Tax=Lysinibacillus capsici TaxID=2115968 RepID=UPI00325FBB08
MKILFIWIKDYKRLKKFQTNFGSKYTFYFNGKDTLQVKDNDIYISEFFRKGKKNKNKNVYGLEISALVGENGSGKSTILDFLVQLMLDENLNDYLIVYSHNGKLYKDYRFNDYDIFNILYLDDQTRNELNIITKNFYDKKHLTIFFSNVFDVRYLNSNFSNDTEEVINISTNALLGRHKNVNEYINEELQRQIFFVNKYKNLFNINNIIELPKKIKIENTNIKKPNDVLAELIENKAIFDLKSLKKNTLFNSQYKVSIFYFIFKDISDVLERYSIGILKEDFLQFFEKSIDVAKNETDFFNIFIKKLNDEGNRLFSSLNFLEDVNKIKDKYLELHKKISGFNKKLIREIILDPDSGEEIVKESLEVNAKSKNVEEFLNYYIKNFSEEAFLKFSWLEMSSGQFSFLTLFSRFSYAIEKVSKEDSYNSYLLLIDEGDLYFHPQLQKDWLYHFIQMIEIIFNGSIQVILTTHSPLVLSDLPNTNVTFLSKESYETTHFLDTEGSPRTFAANISELFSNSFFISDGLIGKFAKERINNYIRWLLNASPVEVFNERDSIIKFIDLIGEPILRNKVYDIYLNKIKLFETNDLVQIIAVLESKLKELKELKAKND